MPRAVSVISSDDDENNETVTDQGTQRTNGAGHFKPRPSSSKQKPGPASSKLNKKNGQANGTSVHNDAEDAEDDPELNMVDTEQDELDRREIRNNIRLLLTDIKDNPHEYTDPKSDRLTHVLERADNIFGKIKKTREGALDSQLVLAIAHSGRQKAQRLTTDFLVFSPKNFILKATSVITRMTLDRIEDGPTDITADEWALFGRRWQHLFLISPSFQFMFGTVAREPAPPRQKKERRAKDKETNLKTDVKQLKSVKEASTKEATSSEVEKIYQLLHEETKPETKIDESRPMCYFDFVINPHSFSQTVENIFYTSFLVKDGWAKISLDEDKLPVIESLERPKEGSEQARERQNNKIQVVMPLTIQEWREIIFEYGIREATIPTRPPHYTANKRKHDP